MNYYQHHIGDYRRDTAHLSLLEHGVYRQLLDMYYLSEEPIPEETEVVFRRLCAKTEEEKTAVLTILKEFFFVENGYSHKRCDAEILAYKAKADRARENGKLGGRPPKTEVVISGLAKETDSKANHKPLTINQEKKDVTNVTSVRSKLADNCPHQEIIDIYHEELPMCPRVRQWTSARQTALRQRWRESQDRQSLDWWRKFFSYVAKSKFLTGQTEGRNGSPPFVASIEWLLKQANMTKVIEGQYHRD